MRHPERVEDYLEHIAEAIERATSYVEPLQGIEAFQQNPQVQDAVVRNIVIHAYFNLGLTTVWRTVQEDLPKVKQQVDHSLRERQAERYPAVDNVPAILQ